MDFEKNVAINRYYTLFIIYYFLNERYILIFISCTNFILTSSLNFNDISMYIIIIITVKKQRTCCKFKLFNNLLSSFKQFPVTQFTILLLSFRFY